jgi:hypothetical protein
MRPAGAIEFFTPCDLSEVALEEAVALISRVTPTKEAPCLMYEVRVASQCLGMAAQISHLRTPTCPEFFISLDCEYAPDEWSLTQHSWGDGTLLRTTVWSPGA